MVIAGILKANSYLAVKQEIKKTAIGRRDKGLQRLQKTFMKLQKRNEIASHLLISELTV